MQLTAHQLSHCGRGQPAAARLVLDPRAAAGRNSPGTRASLSRPLGGLSVGSIVAAFEDAS
jgi:hypothetical protein